MRWRSDAGQDCRLATRRFLRQPRFAAVAASTLAPGIGPTTAIFGIDYSVLLRPLPCQESNRLVAIWITSTREEGLAKIFAAHADYDEIRPSPTPIH